MSLYLAKKTAPDANAPLVFRAKGLTAYAPDSVHNLQIVGRATYPEVAYGLYRQHFDAFCYATAMKRTVTTTAEAYGDLIRTLNVPIPMPTMVFSPAGRLAEDKATAMLNKLGQGASMRHVGQGVEFTVPVPDLTKIAAYIQISNPHHFTGDTGVPPIALQAYVKTMSMLESFLSTNTYPAFKDLNEEVPQVAGMDIRVSSNKRAATKADPNWFSYSNTEKKNSQGRKIAVSYLLRAAVRDGVTSGTGSVAGDDVMDDSDELFDTLRLSAPEIASMVASAKPSGQPSSINFGGPGACPSLPGLVFPYFKGMNRPDIHTIIQVTVTYFARLFGDSAESLRKNLADHKKGLNALAASETGMVLSHIFKGIDLALTTQTRMFLVFKNGYQGFVLLGAHFTVFDGSSWIAPVDAASVQTELAKLDSHNSAIQKLADILSTLTVVEVKAAVDVTPGDLSSSMKIIAEIIKREIEDDEVEGIDQCLHDLVWGKPYVQLGPATFLAFLVDALCPTQVAVGEDKPIYIPTCRAPLGSNFFQHLARFGPDAPSLWNSSGSKISAVDRKRKDGVATTEQPEAPTQIIISSKPLEKAMKDWTEILKTGCISQNAKERARENRCHVVKAEPIRKEIWKALQNGLLVHDLGDGGSVAKKARTGASAGIVTDVDDMLNLL